MNLSELSNEELDRIAAEEVMGWEDSGGTWVWREGSSFVYRDSDHWHPTTCRNQSRMVVEAAEKLGANVEDALHELVDIGFPGSIAGSVMRATPRQEVEAAILAVRASKGEEPT